MPPSWPTEEPVAALRLRHGARQILQCTHGSVDASAQPLPSRQISFLLNTLGQVGEFLTLQGSVSMVRAALRAANPEPSRARMSTHVRQLARRRGAGHTT